MPRTRLCIRDITDADAALAAIDLGADALSFVLIKGDAAYIEPAAAYDLLAGLPPLVSTIGVLADPTLDEFCDIEEACPTTHTLLAGAENESLVRRCGPGVIRSVVYREKTIENDVRFWAGIDEVDAVQIDARAQRETFDWTTLGPLLAEAERPVFLAGAFTPASLAAAIGAVHPYAVELRATDANLEDLVAAIHDAG